MQPPTNKHFPRKRKSRLLTLAVLLVWLALLALIAVNRQHIFDWWQLRGYDAPVTVSSLAAQDTMTDYARRVFYVNQPSIENKASFGESCKSTAREETIVLGCYHSNQQGIYLLSVSDPRLNGVQQVTAAHEMLHAVYDRLSSSERAKVDAMLLDYYHNHLTDERVKTTIDAYKKTEPKDIVNEMHSIFGTEIGHLPSGLEQYYSRYFSDRARIVNYASKYQAEFSSREAIVKIYDAQLESLKVQVNTAQDGLKDKEAAIAAERQKLEELRASGSISAYNAGVPVYNNMVSTYNSQVQTARSLIETYNQLVVKRNAVALEEDQLVNALDNNVETINQ
jgi:hypothetical protein